MEVPGAWQKLASMLLGNFVPIVESPREVTYKALWPQKLRGEWSH